LGSGYEYTIIDHSQDGIVGNGRGYIEDLGKFMPNEMFAHIKLEDSNKGLVDLKLDIGNINHEIKEI